MSDVRLLGRVMLDLVRSTVASVHDDYRDLMAAVVSKFRQLADRS